MDRDLSTDSLDVSELSYDDKGLLPAIVQDASSGDVLMLAWCDQEALRRTLDSGTTWFWSRSRQEYWNKGASSGNVQNVVQVRYDCDLDAVLMLVDATGPACHTGERSCFYRSLGPKGDTDPSPNP